MVVYFQLIILIYFLLPFHADELIDQNSLTCDSKTVDSCTLSNIKESSSSSYLLDKIDKTYYFLYDVNHGEGFNLRRDVYVRIANLVYNLREKTNQEWILVLPPIGPLYHWFNYELKRTQIPWSQFFDIESLNRFVPVIEFNDFLKKFNLQQNQPVVIDYVYYLQHFKEGWGEHFEEKVELRTCNEENTYYDYDNHEHLFNGWFFGYDNIRSKQFHCLSAQGFVNILIDFIIKNLTWSSQTMKPKSVLFDRAETLLHNDYGGINYWRARRSNRIRSQQLNSTDENDRTKLIYDWTKMKREHGAAIGGPYISVHLRRRDYVQARSKQIPSLASAAKQLCVLLDKYQLDQIYLSTDADENEIQEFKTYVSNINSTYRVIHYKPDKTELETILDGGKAIIDQWICAHGKYFIGSYESTFTFRIQEDREIFGFSKETTFNRLCGGDSDNCEKSSVWTIVY
ncbi:unnamed protein product [Didymodactylos carnosus]|uniref:GDP-fucose protein O-fucosyltransferase 2 n=1 Tax=Didymodactylos carnosus TaxID=1234261 RepID=A0A8S2EB23_9BILA|nr:unnamed protein product [Didymodactylos carnosus]CAF3970647.1 unnamed protein product [Didymodactylos carnosus]